MDPSHYTGKRLWELSSEGLLKQARKRWEVLEGAGAREAGAQAAGTQGPEAQGPGAQGPSIIPAEKLQLQKATIAAMSLFKIPYNKTFFQIITAKELTNKKDNLLEEIILCIKFNKFN